MLMRTRSLQQWRRRVSRFLSLEKSTTLKRTGWEGRTSSLPITTTRRMKKGPANECIFGDRFIVSMEIHRLWVHNDRLDLELCNKDLGWFQKKVWCILLCMTTNDLIQWSQRGCGRVGYIPSFPLCFAPASRCWVLTSSNSTLSASWIGTLEKASKMVSRKIVGMSGSADIAPSLDINSLHFSSSKNFRWPSSISSKCRCPYAVPVVSISGSVACCMFVSSDMIINN